MLAWVTSENSTMLLESDSSWLTLAGPYPMLPRLSAPVSGVDCPCPFFHANSLLLASLLSSRQLPSSGSRRQLPFASPYHFRIRRDFRSKNPLSGFAPKQTKESSALAAYPHSATTLTIKEIKTTAQAQTKKSKQNKSKLKDHGIHPLHELICQSVRPRVRWLYPLRWNKILHQERISLLIHKTPYDREALLIEF